MEELDEQIELSDDVDFDNETFQHTFREKRCECCGKVFCRIDYSSYAYKIPHTGGAYYFCSWSCLQRYRREHQKGSKVLTVATEKELRKKPRYQEPVKKRRNKNSL